MRRRDALKAMGVVAAASAVPEGLAAQGARPGAARAATPRAARLETRVVRLKLRHTWTTTMSASDYRDTLHVAYARDGHTGHGEGAPIVRYKEDALSAQKAVESVRPYLLSADPRQYRKVLGEVFKKIEGEWAG